jgi:phage terminase large subunit-like protein
VLFVDGSWNGDSTGIVGCTTDRHLFVVGSWEAPPNDMHWRVPIAEVEETIRVEAKRLGARCVVFDPYRWQRTMQVLEDEGLPIVEFPTNSVARMAPAWKRFYDAVLDEALTHDGDPRLARHIENMRLKIDAQGVRPVKEHKSSSRHIDLGICAVGAFSQAAVAPAPEVVPMVAWR